MEGQPATENIEELEPVPVPTEVEVGNEMPGLALSIEQAEAIDDCLERIAYESEASCIILADVSGQLISERGRMDGMNTQVLSALAAGELSATKEMARLVGERARFSLLLHEGHERSVYLSHVGEHLLLIIVFDSATPIGLVRIILKKAVRELAPIMERQGAGSAGGSLDGDFARLVGNELDSTLDFTTDED
jgi:predicted regulator of Ras-like GTPase activity (Roadblock/LC7/MglB family)